MTAITAWALDVAQRTVKTFAQTLVGMLGAGALSVLHVAWQTDLDVAAFAALVCVLQNVSSFPTPSPVPKPAPLTPRVHDRSDVSNGLTLPPPVVAAPQVGTSATGANGTVFASPPTPPAPPSAG